MGLESSNFYQLFSTKHHKIARKSTHYSFINFFSAKNITKHHKTNKKPIWNFLESLEGFLVLKMHKNITNFNKNRKQTKKTTHIFNQDSTQNNIMKTSRKWSKIRRRFLGIFRGFLTRQGVWIWNKQYENSTKNYKKNRELAI